MRRAVRRGALCECAHHNNGVFPRLAELERVDERGERSATVVPLTCGSRLRQRLGEPLARAATALVAQQANKSLDDKVELRLCFRAPRHRVRRKQSVELVEQICKDLRGVPNRVQRC